MYQVYASIRGTDYRLVKPKSAPLPSWAYPDAWRLLTERSDVGERVRKHCEKYGFYVSAELFPHEHGPAARLMTPLAEALRTAPRS